LERRRRGQRQGTGLPLLHPSSRAGTTMFCICCFAIICVKFQSNAHALCRLGMRIYCSNFTEDLFTMQVKLAIGDGRQINCRAIWATLGSILVLPLI
jgi:hypothetical protein